MSANKGGGCSFFIMLFVIGVFFQMMKDGCGGSSTNSTPSSTPSVNKDANWNYANERLKREGYSNQESSEAADAIIKFHNSKKK